MASNTQSFHFGKEYYQILGGKASKNYQRKPPFKGSQGLEQQLHPRSRLRDAPCARQCWIPQILQALHSEQLSFPDRCSVLCVCCTWFIQTSAVSHSRNLMGNTRFISNLQGEVLRHRRRRKLEEAVTLTPKAEWKIISQLLTLFSRQGHHNSHIPLHQGLISGQ